jgi:hypothetical protein
MAAPVESARASSSSSGVQPSQFERQAQPSVLGGMLMANFAGYAHVAMIISCIYILGFAVTPLLPETRGGMLPDKDATG